MPRPSKFGWLATSLLALALGTGCAEEREPINRVQANALDKTFFVGDIADANDNPVFYSKGFVIDQSANQNSLSVGLYTGTDRIKWEITEDFLIAHKGYQIVQGQDQHGVPDGRPNGTVVARYRVTGHFDIKRSYNPQTGEELNVVEENSSDRPWHQRKYMRVDWSANDVNDPMWWEIFAGKVFGDTEVLPMTYTVTDPNDEHAPYFDTADGYFDVTNKYYVKPGETYKADWDQTLPTCALIGIYTSTTSADCNGMEAVVRHSFWKVKPDHSFEPTENTKRKLDVVANFGGAGDSWQPGFAGGTTQCWDPQYANTEACFHQYLVKHNFWKNSHANIACDSDADSEPDGTADQCAGYEGSKGSQCDLFNKKCTLPLRDRSIQSVGYWMNKETPVDLLDELDETGSPVGAGPDGIPLSRGPMEDVVHSWDQVISAALAYGREAECRRTADADRTTCHDLFFETDGGRDRIQMITFGGWGIPTPKKLDQDMPRAMVSCHAPVRAYDEHSVCGPTGEVARNGDQRKNFIYYWPYDSDARYGGVAGLAQDPETGESHGITATVMGRSATRAAANYRDYIQYAMGDTTLGDVTNGVPQFIYNKIQQNGYSPNSDMARRERGETIEYTHDPAKPAAQKSSSGAQDRTTISDPMQEKLKFENLSTLLRAQMKTAHNPALQGKAQPLWESLAAKIRGTPWEAELVDPGWAMSAIGSDPRQAMSSSTLESASPFRNLDNGRMELWRAEISAKLAAKGVCYMDDVPRIGSTNFQGLMRFYLDKFNQLGMDTDIVNNTRDPAMVKARGEYIYKDLFKGMAKGLAIHEIGHCLGMRHNFASSYDSANYMPQYWQIRSNDGKSAQACNGPRDPNSPDTCMGPRYWDPESDAEMGLVPGQGRPGVGYFGNTSVMEYEADYMSPGMGPYDYYYVKAVYGGVVETYDIDRVAEGGIAEADQQRFVANMGLQLSELNMLDDVATHYTELARELKVFSPDYCREATQEELEKGEWRVVDGKICTQSPRDHVVWKDLLSDAEEGYAVPSRYEFLNFSYWHARPDTEGKSRQRWSYRYGETYGSGYMHTNPSDVGGDVYEVTINNTRYYDITYPLTYFRRGNKEYYYNTIPAQLSTRYFERARAYHWVLEGNDPYLQQFPELYQGYQLAREEAFYFLARAALAPEPGLMAEIFKPDGSVVYDVPVGQATSRFQIGVIDGRFASPEYSNVNGGSWDYFSWVDHASYNIERGFALRALLDGRPTLSTISRDTYIDGRGSMKNFRADQALGLDRLIGGILSEDWTNTAMWVNVPKRNPDGSLGYASAQMLNLLAPNPSRPSGPNAGAVFPNLGYKMELNTLLYAHLFARLNTDMTLLNKIRVYIVGLDNLGALQDAEQVRFFDPGSGFTYVARRFGPDTINGNVVESGIGSRMLERANRIVARAYPVEKDASGDPVLDLYGMPRVVSATVSNSAAAADLRMYVGLIDANRQINRNFDGPIDGYVPEEEP